jgi:cytoskeletal protein RodZ
MANGFLVLDENDWEKATPDQRDWMVFKTLKSLDERMSKLEKRPLADKCFSFLGGVIGGFAAILGMKIGS